jgi:hypothetical protein
VSPAATHLPSTTKGYQHCTLKAIVTLCLLIDPSATTSALCVYLYVSRTKSVIPRRENDYLYGKSPQQNMGFSALLNFAVDLYSRLLSQT